MRSAQRTHTRTRRPTAKPDASDRQRSSQRGTRNTRNTEKAIVNSQRKTLTAAVIAAFAGGAMLAA
ncbi:MAG TPA: hypothetical protein VG865_12430, partial [Casimicrobiaceae bacterium]|nr:hypothetical protein [Casimicrobiaceae bacterium]